MSDQSTDQTTDRAGVPEVTVTVRDNGSYRVTGPVTLLDGEGNAYPVEAGKAVFLCRCGGSANKPFCDSSHRTNGFASAVRVPGRVPGPEAAPGTATATGPGEPAPAG
jgi:CDGSH iron-sulfur domain-containing protein 3